VGEFELADQGFERGWTLLESVAKPITGLTQLRAGLIPEAQTNAFNRVLSGWKPVVSGLPGSSAGAIGCRDHHRARIQGKDSH
jgi:hypothetical protein